MCFLNTNDPTESPFLGSISALGHMNLFWLCMQQTLSQTQYCRIQSLQNLVAISVFHYYKTFACKEDINQFQISATFTKLPWNLAQIGLLGLNVHSSLRRRIQQNNSTMRALVHLENDYFLLVTLNLETLLNQWSLEFPKACAYTQGRWI